MAGAMIAQQAGVGTQTQPSELSPSNYPLALVPSLIASRTVKVNMFERIRAIHDVRDLETNATILTVMKDKESLFHSTKHVKDAQGNLLFEIKERQSTDDTQLYVKDAKDERIMFAGKEKHGRVMATFNNQAPGHWQGTEETLYITSLSQWPQDGSLYIKNQRTDERVALIHREDDEYRVAIAPNVDIALIVAICVCFDYKAKEEGHTKNGKKKDDETSTAEILDALNNAATIFGGGGA